MNNDMITVGKPLPRIAGAVQLDGRKVKVMWRDGRTKIVDLAPALASRRIFIPLREDDELFRTLHVNEVGNAIEWDGPDLEFSAVWLDRLPEAEFTNDEFREAMSELDLSLDGMAASLGISRRLIASYRKDKPIPKHVGYATRYLVGRLGDNEEAFTPKAYASSTPKTGGRVKPIAEAAVKPAFKKAPDKTRKAREQ